MRSRDRVSVAAWRALLYVNFHVLKRLADEMMTEQDLDLSWYEVLLHLGEASGPVNQRDLHERVMLGQSGLSRVLTQMEACELVRRVSIESDRRTLSVELTDLGRERLNRAARVHLAGIKRWFGDELTVQESEAIRAALEKILCHLDAQSNQEPVLVQQAAIHLPISAATGPASDALSVLNTLEPLVLFDAATYITSEDVVSLRHHLSTMARHLNSPLKFIKADWALHLRIAQISPNEALRTVFQSLALTVIASIKSAVEEVEGGIDYLAEQLKHRTDLVDALAASDREAVGNFTGHYRGLLNVLPDEKPSSSVRNRS
jgi:DNA-binding MarR family transcriptional regulator